MIVRPQTTVGIAAEQQRATAEIQAALTVAKASRRDEVDACDRIKNACQRVGLAEKSEYTYSRGGQEINGPTIDLLTVIANCWGNIQFGFRELSQANGESTVEAFAWDLETNAKRVVNFTVPHKRYTKQGSYPLTDPRDIYETVANYAQRRVRACLEAIIPPDVVEDAVEQCRETLRASADVTPDAIKKLTVAFAAMSVTKEQIEKRLGRRIDTMQPAQLVSLRRVYKSIQDGMSKPADWFEADTVDGDTEPKSATDAAKESLRKRKAAATEEPEPPADRPDATPDVDEALVADAGLAFAAAVESGKLTLVSKAEEEYRNKAQDEATRTAISGLATKARADIKGGKQTQQTLAGAS